MGNKKEIKKGMKEPEEEDEEELPEGDDEEF
jgi:hypothetical protein